MTRRRFWYGFTAVIALALLVRVIVVLTTGQYAPQTDAADYDRIAVSLAQHNRFPSSVLTLDGGPTAFRAPLFPIALGAVYKVVGVGSAASRWEAGRLLEAALGAITVALTALIALRLWDRRAALLAGAIAAVYPPLILVGSSLMTESLFIPLALASVLSALLARDRPHRWRWSLAAGVLAACAALTRSNGILLLVPIVFLVWHGRPRLRWAAVREPLVVLIAAVVTLVPWTIRNEHVFHTLVPITTESGYLFAGTYNQYAAHRRDYPTMWVPPVVEAVQVLRHDLRLNEEQLSSRLETVAIDYIRAHPTSVLRVAYWSALRLLNLTGIGVERWAALYEAYPPTLAELSVYAFWALGVLVLGALLARAVRRAPAAFWFCPVVLFAPNLLIAGLTRYRSPVDPFLIMIAALGLLAAWDRLLARRRASAPVLSATA